MILAEEFCIEMWGFRCKSRMAEQKIAVIKARDTESMQGQLSGRGKISTTGFSSKQNCEHLMELPCPERLGL